ncbi:MAG: phosphatidylglycerophosphatase A [Syntrophales bacterium]
MATGLGLGFLPWAPGTAGSLLGIPLYYFIAFFPWPLYLITAAAFACLAVCLAHSAEVLFAKKDASCIVIDEVAGMLFTFFLVTPTVAHIVTGFLLFRFFDIVKFFPANWCQYHLPGGLGIVADDLVAGIYANLTLLGLIYFFGL